MPSRNKGKPKLTLEMLIAVIGAVIAAIGLIDSLRNSRSVGWTVLIVGIAAIGVVLFLFRHRGRTLVLRRILAFSGATALVVALILVAVVRNPASSPSPSLTFPVNDDLVSQISIPNQNGLCNDGGILLGPGAGQVDKPQPGKFALTANTQFSLTLDPQIEPKILVTAIRTIVDQRINARFAGSFQTVPNTCQGVPDSRYFTPNLSRTSADVVPAPNPTGGLTQKPPLTVSQDDPVVIYIISPAVVGSVRWHLEMDWTVGNRHGTTIVSNDGQPFIASQR